MNKILLLNFRENTAIMDINDYFVKVVSVYFCGNSSIKENTYCYAKVGNILKKKLYFDENKQQYFIFKNQKYYRKDFLTAQGYFCRILVKIK